MKEILEKLNLSAVNPGSWSGTQSMQTDKEKLIESINPSSKEASFEDGLIDSINFSLSVCMD